MAKQSEIDKLLEQLEQSEVLKRLILAVKRFWYSDESPSTSVYNANAQSVDQTLGNITKGKIQSTSHPLEAEKLQKLQQENEQLKQRHETLQQQFEQLKQAHQNEMTSLQQQTSHNEHRLKQEANVLKQQVTDLNQQNQALNTELTDYKAQQQQLSQQLEQVKQEQGQAVDLFGNKERTLKADIERLKQENMSLNTRLKDFNWANSLKSEFEFLKQVKSHSEISKILLPNGDDNILQLIATASQWDNVLRVWDALANQVKNTQKEVSATEQQILAHSVILYNLTLLNSQTELRMPEIDTRYDYNIHHQVSGSGRSISQVLLPALYSNNEKIKSALVITE